MRLMHLAVVAGRIPNQVTQSFTTSQTWTAPATTTSVNLTGRGQDGTAAVAPYYGPSTSRTSGVAGIHGFNRSGNPYATTNTPGAWDWGLSQADAPSARNTINAGGSGSFYQSTISQFDTSFHTDYSSVAFTDAIPGSASTSVTAGWKTSGAVVDGDSGFSSVSWLEYGTYYAGSSATNGSDTVGFGHTFAGGMGGAATSANFASVAVTPGNSYPMTIPAGGSITIVYFQ